MVGSFFPDELLIERLRNKAMGLEFSLRWEILELCRRYENMKKRIEHENHRCKR